LRLRRFGFSSVPKYLMPKIVTGRRSGNSALSCHCFHIGAKRRKQKIAARFNARGTILGSMQSFGHPRLRKFGRLAQIAQRHFFLDQLRGARLDFRC
jgi:hypothetical protein